MQVLWFSSSAQVLWDVVKFVAPVILRDSSRVICHGKHSSSHISYHGTPFQIRETTRKMMRSFSKSKLSGVPNGSRRSSAVWQGCTRSGSNSPGESPGEETPWERLLTCCITPWHVAWRHDTWRDVMSRGVASCIVDKESDSERIRVGGLLEFSELVQMYFVGQSKYPLRISNLPVAC